MYSKYPTRSALRYQKTETNTVPSAQSHSHFNLYICINNFIYLLIFGCTEPLLLGTDFLSPQQVGATLLWGVQASHRGGFSWGGAWALGCTGFSSCGRKVQQLQLPCYGAQARQVWHTDSAVLQRVESSWTRGQTRGPCIGKWILTHWTTKEVPHIPVLFKPQLFMLPKKPTHHGRYKPSQHNF